MLGDVAVVEGVGGEQDIVVDTAQQERAEGDDEQELPGGTGGQWDPCVTAVWHRVVTTWHHLHQLKDVREHDAGKAIPLMEVVDVWGC